MDFVVRMKRLTRLQSNFLQKSRREKAPRLPNGSIMITPDAQSAFHYDYDEHLFQATAPSDTLHIIDYA